jgi:hypothetical protein
MGNEWSLAGSDYVQSSIVVEPGLLRPLAALGVVPPGSGALIRRSQLSPYSALALQLAARMACGASVNVERKMRAE